MCPSRKSHFLAHDGTPASNRNARTFISSEMQAIVPTAPCVLGKRVGEGQRDNDQTSPWQAIRSLAANRELEVQQIDMRYAYHHIEITSVGHDMYISRSVPALDSDSESMPGLVDPDDSSDEESDDDLMPGLEYTNDGVRMVAYTSALPAPLCGGCAPSHSSGEESDDDSMPNLESASSSDDEVEDDGVPSSEYMAGDVTCASASPAPLCGGCEPGKGWVDSRSTKLGPASEAGQWDERQERANIMSPGSLMKRLNEETEKKAYSYSSTAGETAGRLTVATEQGTFAKDVRRCGALTSVAGLNLWITCQLLRAASFSRVGEDYSRDYCK